LNYSLPSLRARLRDNEILIGTLISLPSTDIVECLSSLSVDWLFIDAEHGAFGPETVCDLLRAAHECPCLVRIPSVDEAWIKKVLDAGAAGIIVPQINHLQQAHDVVKFAKYAPQGNRGVGLGRAHGYGKDFSSYLDNANDHTVIVLQAETESILECIDDVTAIPEVDAILIGPYDLSASLGHIGDLQHPSVQLAIKTVLHSCQNNAKAAGIFGVCADDICTYKQMGFSLLAVGVDTVFLQSAATAELEKLLQA